MHHRLDRGERVQMSISRELLLWRYLMGIPAEQEHKGGINDLDEYRRVWVWKR